MGMTMTEKILARGAGRDSVRPGDLVLAKVDFAMGHDLTIPPAGKIMREQMGAEKIWDPARVAETLKFVYHNRLKEWVEAKDLILYVIGQIGVDGARSKAMEHVGEALKYIDMEARLTITNMAIEAGAKNGILEFDEITKEYLDSRAKRPYTPVTSDPDAEYEKVFEFDVEKVELGVAKPMSPDNYAPLSEVAGTRLDQVFIGSCTNSRITDLRRAAAVLEGRKVAPGVRLIITPSSHLVAIQAEKEGLIGTFLAAGAAWTTATCGACLGGHMGVLGEGEVCLSTTNRNFPGRMGHPKAMVYLSNPAVAAASAVTGEITHPAEILKSAPKVA